jgi:hypothetical protein
MNNHQAYFTPLLDAFADSARLKERLVTVLQALPPEVQRDFLDDPRFRITKLSMEANSGGTLLALPTADGRGSRCVVLKQRLAECSEAFGLYVIAHELAHAYLHNGSWGEFADPEEAADALAASWGFRRPASWF